MQRQLVALDETAGWPELNTLPIRLYLIHSYTITSQLAMRYQDRLIIDESRGLIRNLVFRAVNQKIKLLLKMTITGLYNGGFPIMESIKRVDVMLL